jgi:hypothetical protein
VARAIRAKNPNPLSDDAIPFFRLHPWSQLSCDDIHQQAQRQRHSSRYNATRYIALPDALIPVKELGKMFTFTPLQGAQSESSASQSLLELDGGVKVLVDVGWDETFNVAKLKELEK